MTKCSARTSEMKCHLMRCCHLLVTGDLASHFQHSISPSAFGRMHPSLAITFLSLQGAFLMADWFGF